MSPMVTITLTTTRVPHVCGSTSSCFAFFCFLRFFSLTLLAVCSSSVPALARERIHTAAAIPRLSNAAKRTVQPIPSVGIRRKPAAEEPSTAPRVLIPYSLPTVQPSFVSLRAKNLQRTGSVAPIRPVGTRRMTPQTTTRRSPISWGEMSELRYR